MKLNQLWLIIHMGGGFFNIILLYSFVCKTILVNKRVFFVQTHHMKDGNNKIFGILLIIFWITHLKINNQDLHIWIKLILIIQDINVNGLTQNGIIHLMIHHLDHYLQEYIWSSLIRKYITYVYKTTIAFCSKTSHSKKIIQISVCFVLNKIIMRLIITIYTDKQNVILLTIKINARIGTHHQTYLQIQSNGHWKKLIIVGSMKHWKT